MFSGLELKSDVGSTEPDPIEQAKILAKSKAKSGGALVKKKRKKKQSSNGGGSTKNSVAESRSVSCHSMFSGMKITSRTSTGSEMSRTSAANDGIVSNIVDHSHIQDIPLPEPLPLLDIKSPTDLSPRDSPEQEIDSAAVEIEHNNFIVVQNDPTDDLQSTESPTTNVEAETAQEVLVDTKEAEPFAFSFMNEENFEEQFVTDTVEIQNVNKAPKSHGSSIMEVVSTWIHELEQEKQKVSELHQSFADEQARVLNQKKNVISLISKLKASLKTVQKQQASASLEENFSLAIELDEQIEKLQQQITSNEAEYAKLQRTSEINQSNSQQCSGELLEVFTSVIHNLSELKEEQEHEKEEVLEQIQLNQTKEEIRLKKETTNFESEKKALQQDQKALSTQQEKTQQEIEQNNQELIQEKRTLEEKDKEIENEIQELMEQIRRKQNEQEEVREKLQNIHRSIKEATKPFQDTLRHHKINEQFIEERTEQLAQSENRLEQMRAKLVSGAREQESTENIYQSNISSIAEYIEQIQSLFTNKNFFFEVKEKTFQRFAAFKEEITHMQGSYNRAIQQKTKLAQETRSLCDKEISHRKELAKLQRSFTEIKESLEQAAGNKKLAIASRNFKEAGKITSEIQELQGQHESSAERIEELQQLILSTSQTIAQNNSELELQEASTTRLLQKLDTRKIEVLTEKSVLLKQLLTQHKETDQTDTVELKILLEECNMELDALQRDFSQIEDPAPLNDSQGEHEGKESNIETSSGDQIQQNEGEKADTTKQLSPVLNERSSQLRQKADLREQIASLENEIMSLVDQDRFEEADELEQERVRLQALLNSL